jgi:hypothetical protein
MTSETTTTRTATQPGGADPAASGPPYEQLRAALFAAVDPQSVRWLEDAEAAVRREPAALAGPFSAAGRRMGRDLLVGAPPTSPAWSVAAAARTVLLAALLAGADATDGLAELHACWRHGTADEQLAVVQAVSVLDVGEGVRSIVLDALRTNDVRLVTAAMGRWAAARLDDESFAHGVLKCVFMGIPLQLVTGLEQRTTAELSRMLASFAHERIAAGRTVPADVWPVIDAHPPADVIAAIEAELDHPVDDRRDAARAALAERRA